MRYGFVLPGGSALEQVGLAVAAETAGWDGVFVFEVAYGIDAWTLLGAMAMRTSRVRLGTMLTPLPWRRPWKVAGQALTLDHLSAGRAIITVGLGAVDDDLGSTGEETGRRERAAVLDEGIDVMTKLWAGERRHRGARFDIDLSARADLADGPSPVQAPRMPLWVVGAWPRERSMARVLRCDGIVPMCFGDDGYRPTQPDDVRDIATWLVANGDGRPFDIVIEGETPDSAEGAPIVAEWADAGATWWLETRWTLPDDAPEEAVRQRIAAGPPR